jgi:hypothetical protein
MGVSEGYSHEPGDINCVQTNPSLGFAAAHRQSACSILIGNTPLRAPGIERVAAHRRTLKF